MGVINARNLRRAKRLLDQNRHRVGDIVEKTGQKLDQVSGGKTAAVTAKAAEAAKRYSAGGDHLPGTSPASAPTTSSTDTGVGDPIDVASTDITDSTN